MVLLFFGSLSTGFQEALQDGSLQEREIGGRKLYYFPEHTCGEKETQKMKADAKSHDELTYLDEEKFFAEHNWTWDVNPKELEG